MNYDQRLVDIKRLSQILGKSEHAIRYHVKKGRIKPAARFGRVYAFDPDEVLKQLQRGVRAI